jgi:transposase
MAGVYRECVRVQCVCLRSPGDGPQRRQEVRTFGTTTRELLRLTDWLTAVGCTHVAMESTGVYWRPVYNLLEERFELSLVNAQHVKMVPGRKTDVRDSEWLAQLLDSACCAVASSRPRCSVSCAMWCATASA